MSVTAILDRIISRKKQATLSVADSYLSLVRDIASGSEVDADHAADVIDSAGKDAGQFEKDVAIMQKRFELASQVKARNELQKTLPTLQRQSQAAKDKLDAAIRELQPIAAQAEIRVHEVQTRIGQYSMSENQLIETCLDASLLQREAELIAQRRVVVEKLEPIKYDLWKERSYLQTNEQSCLALQQRIKENKSNHPAVGRYREDLERDRALVESGSVTVRDLQEAVDGLNAELSQLNSELAEIAKAKLVP